MTRSLTVADRYKTPTIWHACKRITMTFQHWKRGSGGLEGPVIPVGESLGAFVAKRFGIQSADDLTRYANGGYCCSSMYAAQRTIRICYFRCRSSIQLIYCLSHIALLNFFSSGCLLFEYFVLRAG